MITALRLKARYSQPSMKQTDRVLNWKKQTTDEILRRIFAADDSPGVLDKIYGERVFLYNAYREANLKGKAGDIIATANHAICRATIDGAIWICHFKPESVSGEQGVKLPAALFYRLRYSLQTTQLLR